MTTSTSRKHIPWIVWPLALIAVIVLGVVICEVQGWPFLKGPAQNTLSKRLDRPVTFGDVFRLKLFGSIRFDTDALRVGEPRGLSAGSPLGGDLVDARDAHVEVPYGTVWQLLRGHADGPPRITALRFGGVDASLKRLADGHANWVLVPGRHDAAPKPVELPVVDELVVEKGHVIYDDAVIKTALEAQVHTREGANERSPAPSASAASAPGAAVGPAGLVIDGKGRHENRPFEFHVTSSGVLPLVAREHASPVPITIRLVAADSKFSFDGTGTDVLSFQAMDGAATLSGPSLARIGDAFGITLPTTEPFNLKGRLSKSGQQWALRKADLDVGDSHLGGEFSYDRAPKVPMLSGELNGSRLVLADLLPAFGVPRPGSGNPKPPPGHVLPQREFDIPSLHWMNANVKVRLQRAELGTLFRQPLAPLQGDLALQGGVLQLTNLLARAAGGELRGSVGLDGSDTRQALWSADVRWAGMELDQWLRARNTKSQVTKPSGENPGFITGKIGGHALLHANGKSTAKMIATTDGTVQAWIRDGTISHLIVEAAGIDFAQALGLLFVGDDPLPMQCAAVKANAKGGILSPEVAIIDTRDSTLLVDGHVSLVDEGLDLRLTSKPKDMSPATLRTPVHLQGTFEHPQVHLEKKPIAGKLMIAAALGAMNPLAALIPLFDPGDKEAAGGCQRALAHLRDANGPATARDARAPKAKDVPPDPPARHAAASAPIRR